MSNLRYLRKIVKEINEKKNPFFNELVGEVVSTDVEVDQRSNDYYVDLVEVDGTKLRITTRDMYKVGPFQKYYLVINKRNGNEFERIMYNEELGQAVIHRIEREPDLLTEERTVFGHDNKEIYEAKSITNMYTYDKFVGRKGLEDLQGSPIEVVFASVSSGKIKDIEPNFTDEFESKIVVKDGKKSIETKVKNKYEEEDFSELFEFYDSCDSIMASFRAYQNGDIRPSHAPIAEKRRIKL